MPEPGVTFLKLGFFTVTHLVFNYLKIKALLPDSIREPTAKPEDQATQSHIRLCFLETLFREMEIMSAEKHRLKLMKLK